MARTRRRRPRRGRSRPPDRPSSYYFDEEAARRACEFFPRFLRHTKGEWAGQPFELAPWQREIIRTIFGWKRKADGLRRYRTAYVEVPTTNGKLLALDTPIPTPAGWTMVGGLAPGECVFDVRGRPTPVLAVSDTETPVCYRVTFSDGTAIVAGADHVWYTEAHVNGGVHGRRRVWADNLRTTEQIRETLRVQSSAARGLTHWNHRIPVAAPLITGATRLPIPPYTLGVWLGDGSRGTGIFTKKPAAEATVIVGRIRSEGMDVDARPPGCWAVRGLRARLGALGILKSKAIPAPYLRASLAQRTELIAGLMDTDGFCSPAGQCEFSTTSQLLRDGMLELLRAGGLKPTLKVVRAMLYGKDCGEAYRIQFWAYQDSGIFSLPRKRARLKPRPTSPTRAAYRQIVAVEPVPPVPMRCIQVADPLGLYLAGPGMVPTHNSTLAAGIGLYLLHCDKEPGAEIYSLAKDRSQAAIVFDEARAMSRGSPHLDERCEIYRRSIVVPETRSSYQVLSSDVPTKEGLNPHGILFDELHVQDDRELWDTLRTGMGARRQPLTVALTTAGFAKKTLCGEMHDKALAMLAGVAEDETFLPVVYGIGEKEDWEDREVWRRVNPNLGVSVKMDFLEQSHVQAVESPAFQNTFRRYHLNEWVQQEIRWIDQKKWAACAGATPWPDMPALLRRRPCYAGLDLSTTTDLSALVLLFDSTILAGDEDYPTEEEVEIGDGIPHIPGFEYGDPLPAYDVVPWFWCPEEGMRIRSRRDKVPYEAWRDEGAIIATEGDAVDHGMIRKKIQDLTDDYIIQELAADAYNAHKLLTELEQEDGLTVVRMSQGIGSMSPPTKALDVLYRRRQIRHGGHPVLTWCAHNATLAKDSYDNWKPSKEKSPERIDGIVALVMALARALLSTGRTEDVRIETL